MAEEEQGIAKWPLLASAVLLIASSLAVWPRWFYIGVRGAVCASAIYAIWYCSRNHHLPWSLVLAAIAVLFNPIFPIRLGRNPWHAVEFVAALLLLISAGVGPDPGRVKGLKSRLD